MRNRIAWVLSAALFAFFLAGISSQALAEAKGPMQFVAEAKAKIVEVTPQQVKADMDTGKPVILLDVRDSVERVNSHTEKAHGVVSRGLFSVQNEKLF